MPHLPSETIEKLYLPSTADLPEADKAWVELSTGRLLAGDILSISDGEQSFKAGFEMLTSRIRNWNFTDENNQPVPITLDTVARLEMEDTEFLFNKLTSVASKTQALSDDQKKSL